ncbi:MAG: sulfurtransferase-like selenium metabolism protein YedF [Anaerolineales bacterium]|nr:sulfurtransferase-like selenium metabolism protein YedF [Anaerolineales bacterium]
MKVTIDARGLGCPQPVILSRSALLEGNDIVTIVDNESARHNVSRMAEKEGCSVVSEVREDGIFLAIHREGSIQPEPEAAAAAPAGGPLVLAVQQDRMGHDDEELGSILIRGFFHTLGEVKPLPDTIIFYNSGVKLTVEGSPVLEDLHMLVEKGIEILACGTCLGHFELTDRLVVGEISNMYSIAEALLGAGKVVNV